MMDNGYNEEEMKMVKETRKILSAPDMQVCLIEHIGSKCHTTKNPPITAPEVCQPPAAKIRHARLTTCGRARSDCSGHLPATDHGHVHTSADHAGARRVHQPGV